MKDRETYDLLKGMSEREINITKVLSNSGTFMTQAMAIIASLPPGEYTGEDFTRACQSNGVIPHRSNAFGALILKAIRRGMIIKTGRIGSMKRVSSHAHNTPIYIKPDAVRVTNGKP